jgi:hypothetical protein
MKPITQEAIFALILIAFVITSNGCITRTVIRNAKGVDKYGWPTGETNGVYYALIPLTVPADMVTSPFQLFYICIGGTELAY